MRVMHSVLAVIFVCASYSNASAALITFNSRAAFDLAAPGLPVETFEESTLGANSIAPLDDPLNSTTNNAYFAPGDILPGLSIDTPLDFGSGDLYTASAGFAGNTSDIVGANFFVDSLDLHFTGTSAVGLDLVSLFSASTFSVSVFGAGDTLLDTFMVAVSATGTFFGVISDSGLITRINLFSTSGAAEGVDNVAFGIAQVPEPTSMFLLGTGLVGIAARRYRRRKP